MSISGDAYENPALEAEIEAMLHAPTLPPEPRQQPLEALTLGMALDASGMTREDFARKILGVDPSTVYRWLHGRPIPLTVQDRITHYLTTGV